MMMIMMMRINEKFLIIDIYYKLCYYPIPSQTKLLCLIKQTSPATIYIYKNKTNTNIRKYKKIKNSPNN